MEMHTETPLVHFYGVCERANESFWAEPINAFTNLAFIYASIRIYHYYRDHTDLRGKWVWDIHILTALLFMIGCASLLFHTLPNRYTEIGDVIFIVAFIVIYFNSAVHRVTGCNWFETIICFMAFAGVSHIIVSQFPHAINDSIGYLSSMAALSVIAFYLNMKQRPSARHFLNASLVGVISLFFRGVDNAVCDMIPIGTHFMWHLLNALLCYLLMIQLIRNVNRRARLARQQKKKKLELENA